MLLAEKDVKDSILGTATPENYPLHLLFIFWFFHLFIFSQCIDVSNVSNSQNTVGIVLVKHSLMLNIHSLTFASHHNSNANMVTWLLRYHMPLKWRS